MTVARLDSVTAAPCGPAKTFWFSLFSASDSLLIQAPLWSMLQCSSSTLSIFHKACAPKWSHLQLEEGQLITSCRGFDKQAALHTSVVLQVILPLL